MSDEQPSPKTHEPFSRVSPLIKLLVAVGLMVVVILTVPSVLTAPPPGIPVAGAQPEKEPVLTFKVEADEE